MICLTLIFIFFFTVSHFFDRIRNLEKQGIVAILFVTSVFLFHPLFNVTLILGLVFYLRRFSFVKLAANRMNLLFIALFLVYAISALVSFENGSREFSTVERLLPLVLIPIMFVSVAPKAPLYFLAMFACVTGIVLFGFAFSDVLLIGSMDFLSFDHFANFYHPVYLSYMVFFAICYVQEHFSSKTKYAFQLALFGLLVFLGSKMVLSMALILFLLFFVDYRSNGKKVLLVGCGLLAALMLFRPVQNRFKEIIDYKDLSVLNETKLEPNDDRINGLTLRLILWREAFATLENWQERIFGNGAARSKERELKQRLEKLGLRQHIDYNPHNQFIDTYMRTGILGLAFLLAIPIWAVYLGKKKGYRMLTVVALFAFLCMFTEAIFGRVRGVYFFTTIFILLTNNLRHAQNSDIRNKRRPEPLRRV
ncbi:O-antigen ligase family protein [Flagellimonas sp. DF-77]|uniref:O-antigen ligase family protein n=1 Tax=Flagellimonas algarum TaxID=3230298 RepID=UPI003395EAE8